MNWSGNFREGLAREIRENNSLYSIILYCKHTKHTVAIFKKKNQNLDIVEDYPMKELLNHAKLQT